jgi:hypothetical protein
MRRGTAERFTLSSGLPHNILQQSRPHTFSPTVNGPLRNPDPHVIFQECKNDSLEAHFSIDTL